MKFQILAIILLITSVFVSCTPAVAATPHIDQESEQPELDSTSPPTTVQDPLEVPTQEPASNLNGVGMHYTGQGPTTFPIQKDPGMALLRLKVKNCSSLIISGKGQNIPYLDPTLTAMTFPNQPRQFEDQYQNYNGFQGSPNREATILLDSPRPFEDFDSPPHTEMLRIEDVSEECMWEATILPMNAARPIAPGQIVSGEYSDVLAVSGDLRAVELLFMSPGHDRMLQDFGGVLAVTNDGISLIEESLDAAGLYENFPPGTLYLVIDSRGYWELQGK